MIQNKEASGIKKKTALAAILVGSVLFLLTFLFVQGVKKQLWEQSINTIMESTRQGCSTLKVQLGKNYESMETIAGYVEQYTKEQEQELADVMEDYSNLESGVQLYLSDGTCIPKQSEKDEAVEKALQDKKQDSGILDPHISSVTGVNVFELFVRVKLQDDTTGYLIKQYEVESIVDSFSLSFYNDAGFSYVVNTQGDVLIRSPHPNSNKTVQNLFDMLPAAQNEEAGITEFRQSLEDLRTGWAVFYYQEEDTVFCYTPLKLDTDWYLISIIPKQVVDAQTNVILLRSLALIASILVGIFLLFAFYLHYVNKTNKRLRSQANYIGHLYNAIPEGVALLTVDQPYHLLQLNREGLRLLSYPDSASNDAPKGVSLQEIIHPDEYQQVIRLSKVKADRDNKHIFENRVMKKDGTYFWAAGIVEKTLDENENPVLIATFHDVTEEKLRAEEAERQKLQERLTLVGAISNAYPVIISVNLTRDSLGFIYIDPALKLNIGKQETYSELFEDMLHTIHEDSLSDYISRFALKNLREVLGTKKEVFMEARQMLTDDVYHWTSTQIIHVDNPYSEDRLAILISRRIDEQRYEEEQQRQALQSALDNAMAASRAKSQFLSNMSHDIRTPMNAIVGMAAIAAAHLNDRDRVAECLKKIGLSSKHLLSLINDVLDMSKIESGKLSLRYEPFNFGELISELTELLKPQADANRLNLEVELTKLRNEKVIGDPLRVRQVCINILSNAIKYTPAGGNIHVTVTQKAGNRKGYLNYVFCCEDTGIGMSGEFIERIFQPFERAQDSTSSKVTGTGLGMAITKNVVDLMNGDIQVESTPGAGSVFTVTLPLKLQENGEEEVPQEWIGVRCLMVDDDRLICENAAELLDDMGLRAEFVTDGSTAVHKVLQAEKKADPYGLVIVDWKMPDMDGVEVTRRIRKVIGAGIPVIVLTAYDWSEIEREAVEAGVTAFLAKPFYHAKLCGLLEELSGEKSPKEMMRPSVRKDYSDKRILLVEDNEINREIARELIGETGARIEEACDGEEAVKMVSDSGEGYYDMILMDIQMPQMDGYEATKIIRGMDREDVKKMSIIAMTANAFAEDAHAAIRAGMNAHFPKPIDMDALDKLLYQYLAAE